MDTIAGKYRILKELGSGAMGDVYLVMPPRGEPVALKLLKSVENDSDNNDLVLQAPIAACYALQPFYQT